MIIFPQLSYFVFLAVVVLVYWRLNHRSQNVFFLLCSYIFYATWDWRFLSLIIGSAGVVYFTALRLSPAKDGGHRDLYLYFNIIWNLGLLCYFKYMNFFIKSLDPIFASLHINANHLHLNIILPLGISFFTFELLSYTFDVYRGVIQPTRSFIDLSLFIAFFPKLIAGPIQRATNLLVQIQKERVFDGRHFMSGIDLIVWGLVKKLVIADNLAAILYMVFRFEKPSIGLLLAGGLGFGIQLYADFSAYTDFARGSSRLLGFELINNFNKPFLAKNVMDFWNRWHISLTSWMKDYLFLPLVFKLARLPLGLGYAIAVLVSWGCVGVWHGAEWKYLVWGIYYAVLIIGYQFVLKPVLDLFWKENLFTNAMAIFVTWIVVTIGFLLIRIPSLGFLWMRVKDEIVRVGPEGHTRVQLASFADRDLVTVLLIGFLFYSIPLLCSLAWKWLQDRQQWDLYEFYGLRFFLYTLAGLILMIFAGINQNDFIYFRF